MRGGIPQRHPAAAVHRRAAAGHRAEAVVGVGGAARGRERPDALVAWEPVWAIGADRPAEPEYIRAVCDGLRGVARRAPADLRRQRGPGLIAEIGRSVDGLFLGRFAHDRRALAGVIDEAAPADSATSAAPHPSSSVRSRYSEDDAVM